MIESVISGNGSDVKINAPSPYITIDSTQIETRGAATYVLSGGPNDPFLEGFDFTPDDGTTRDPGDDNTLWGDEDSRDDTTDEEEIDLTRVPKKKTDDVKDPPKPAVEPPSVKKDPSPSHSVIRKRDILRRFGMRR